jgi:cholesterol transport system auxiliary component
MLGPLLVAAIERTAAFRAVVMSPGAANGQLRLDTEIVRLQHEFQTRPSRVRFTLRAMLVDEKTRAVIALREFEVTANATQENAYGGVVAANQAVQSVLINLSQFLKEGEK